MTLADLYKHLLPAFPVYVRKDVQTAVRVLASALDCSDPQHCFPEHFDRPLPTLYQLVERYQITQGKKPHTIRNNKNKLSLLFRHAHTQHLLSLPPPQLVRSYNILHKTSRPGSAITRPHGISIPFKSWPSELQEAFTAFATWSTAPMVPGRDAQLKKRPVTVNHYRIKFESYFGYLHHIEHVPQLAFDQLFDLTLVNNYVLWHVNVQYQRPTATIRLFLTMLISLSHHYRPLPDFRAEVIKLLKRIPVPSPLYDKADAWVSCATLRDIARALWPHKLPQDLRICKNRPHTGLQYAGQAGISLMLQLWTYIPYRQRNMREMQLDTNLYKDTQGHWRIKFHGEQLKIARRRGKTNVFDLRFPPQLVPVLEDYLTLWRPILLARAGHPDPHVFLTQFGNVYNRNALGSTTSHIVYRYTGKHWHPHVIRTVWATEMIRKGLNFLDVAEMLNDKLETVIANYAHLLHGDVAEKVYRLIDEPNGQGK